MVASSRSYLSDSIHQQWPKGHLERTDIPPAAWSCTQWGIYLADALAKNRDIGSFPHSSIPSIRIHTIPLQDILLESTPLDSWRWAGPDGSPPLGNLRATLSHQRVLAYRTNRDLIRSGRGASPTWLDSHQSMGAASWSYRSRSLRKRVQALRTLWDLRWHGENKAVATQSHDPVRACPICHRFWSQAHYGRPDGTYHEPQHCWIWVGQALLTTFNQPTLMARRWSGQWDQDAIRTLQPNIARCNRKQIKAVLGHIGRVTSNTASACWRLFSAMVKDLSPPVDPYPPPTPMVARQTRL